ncbi:PREDICTED: WAT1-related [Prunus dulcis]|uniref:PREDICTED: WAT1-related n=1 Tax=Prunus dulcis TaxID=3755 RepID=A0A5E4F2C3_PRUDU|nr:PREDICTED: WAT1-related [Prunus dulcis]
MKKLAKCALHNKNPWQALRAHSAAYTGMNIFYKMATEVGMNLTVLVVYRNMFSAALMVPVALIIEWRSRPKLTLATISQNFYVQSLALTSTTSATAITKLVPAITFVIAICFMLERLALGTHAGRAKVVGTLVGIGGTMVFTFYKGKEIAIWSIHVNLLHKYTQQNSHVASSHRNTGSQLLGSLLALGSSTSFALWLVFQSVAFALCRGRDWSQWKLGWDIKLLTAVYAGVVTTGLVFTVIAWCVQMRGPLFVSIFNPLCLLLVALSGSLLLHEKLYLGSFLGGFLIICGLYLVIWGKSIEMRKMTRVEPMETPRPSEAQTIEIVSTTPMPIHSTTSRG